jgi:DNA adenine methylase
MPNKVAGRLRPIIRYPGGKTGMLWRMREVMPPKFKRYIEPYVGGAAVLLDTTPQRAIIGDMNLELITCYKALAANVEGVIAAYKELWGVYAGVEAEYYKIRGWDRLQGWPVDISEVGRAARFLFICHTCFNGRYQVNRRGQCNTTWGRILAPRVSAEEKIRAAGEYLGGATGAKVEIHLRDGVATLDEAKAGDFAFIDPPYIPLSKTAKFTEYTPGGFSFTQQMRLCDAMDRATERGVMWAYTNADRPILWEHFGGLGYKCERVPMRRNMGGDAATRIEIGELLVTNFERVKA